MLRMLWCNSVNHIPRGSDSPVVNVCNSSWMEKEDREFELKELMFLM